MVGGLNKQIYLPNMLAQQLGYFKAENLDVTLIDEGSGQGSEEALIAKQVQAGSGAYSHTIELQPKGKFIETICQFGIAPGEAEMVSTKHPEIQTAADLKGKNLGVTSLGSGTQTVTSAIIGKAGLSPTNDAKWVPVGAGDTFIAAMKQGTIDAGMTTEPTISRLIASGDAKILVDLLTPSNTRKALGGDYPFIGIFMQNDYVAAHKDTTQHLVNAYVKTLKWMNTTRPPRSPTRCRRTTLPATRPHTSRRCRTSCPSSVPTAGCRRAALRRSSRSTRISWHR